MNRRPVPATLSVSATTESFARPPAGPGRLPGDHEGALELCAPGVPASPEVADGACLFPFLLTGRAQPACPGGRPAAPAPTSAATAGTATTARRPAGPTVRAATASPDPAPLGRPAAAGAQQLHQRIGG